ncbi:sulfite exporter TauE/SafE family protein [Alphaproteobacteria bacterium]|nr:sulfite exporter TauE/SafE family protein [Alphaproteobacteria bacterium]MDC1120972.1 sulfite exporter TauE/SafE family protein [Alphaproteobacteria bacterium]
MLLLASCFFGLFAGLLIGAAGIGGVILVPLLVYFAGVDIHTSIAAAVAAFLVSGFVGTVVYSQRGIIQWIDFMLISTGAIPGAFIGAYVLPKINAQLLTFFIAIALLVSAVRQIRSNKMEDVDRPFHNVSKHQMALVGLVTGFFSVLSGTGGPLVLLPLLTWLSVPLVTAIGLSQAIQLPIAIFATVGNEANNLVNWDLVLFLAIGLAIGSFIGAKLSKSLPVEHIKALVAFLLFGSGAYMIIALLLS